MFTLPFTVAIILDFLEPVPYKVLSLLRGMCLLGISRKAMMVSIELKRVPHAKFFPTIPQYSIDPMPPV
jgi:hypothetical protein